MAKDEMVRVVMRANVPPYNEGEGVAMPAWKAARFIDRGLAEKDPSPEVPHKRGPAEGHQSVLSEQSIDYMNRQQDKAVKK